VRRVALTRYDPRKTEELSCRQRPPCTPNRLLLTGSSRGRESLHGSFWRVHSPLLAIRIEPHRPRSKNPSTSEPSSLERQRKGLDANGFFVLGVPASVPVSPEHAVRIVAELSDARVSAIPELILPGRGFVPQYARWRIQLERPVTLRGEQTGRAYVGSELYVGLRGHVSTAAEAQPPGSLISDPDTRRSVTVARRANLPLEFEPVGRWRRVLP
jgi:hypothetical protein